MRYYLLQCTICKDYHTFDEETYFIGLWTGHVFSYGGPDLMCWSECGFDHVHWKYIKQTKGEEE